MSAHGGPRPRLDIYLQPAVVGGGLGDIEEVLAVGRRLWLAGWPLRLYRAEGRRLPEPVEGPWGWPPVRRLRNLGVRAPRALTVTPWWGVSAAPAAERSGRPGDWSEETARLERAYGTDRVVHLSLEEFARTWTSRQQTRERWREGGVVATDIARRISRPSAAGEIRAFRDAYRTWRAFDRPNVVHLYTGFLRSPAFQHEFPEAVQTGPLWPGRLPGSRQARAGRWVWYASPSSSDRLARRLAHGFSALPKGSHPLRIEVRGPRRFELPPARGLRWSWRDPSGPREWAQAFARAELRIVTGSRTLLEALSVGGPFLYFNGVLDRGRRTRRHRPEKIDALLRAWRRHGVSAALCADLSDFSRLRRVEAIARKAWKSEAWRRTFPDRSAAVEVLPGREDAGTLITGWVSAWSRSSEDAPAFVRRLRASPGGLASRL